MYYWFAATFLITANAACVAANMLMLPGNWFMVGTLCLFLLTAGSTTGPDSGDPRNGESAKARLALLDECEEYYRL